MLASEWYQKRLETYRDRQLHLWEQHKSYLKHFLASPRHAEEAHRLEVHARLTQVEKELSRLTSSGFLKALEGTIGADPLYRS